MRSRGVLLLRAVVLLVLHGDADGDLAAEHVADHLGLLDGSIWHVHLREVEVERHVRREHLARDLLDQLLERNGVPLIAPYDGMRRRRRESHGNGGASP